MKSLRALMLIGLVSQTQAEISPKNLSESKLRALKNFQVLAQTDLNKIKNQYRLEMYSAMYHKRKCRRALRKLSVYEEYTSFIDSIKSSRYNESTSELYLLIELPVIKKKMSLQIVLPRITKAGLYPFTFKNGFLKGLKGVISVQPMEQGCLLGYEAQWQGDKFPFSLTIFELATETLNKIVFDKMRRISR